MKQVRPPKLKTINFTIRISEHLNIEVERWARDHDILKSQAVRQALRNLIRRK